MNVRKGEVVLRPNYQDGGGYRIVVLEELEKWIDGHKPWIR